jgi:hypothetical protein
MPQVHLKSARKRVSVPTIAGLIQRYTGMGMVEARRLAERVVAGKTATVHTDDHDAAFDLTDQLMTFGVEAEADEGDY